MHRSSGPFCKRKTVEHKAASGCNIGISVIEVDARVERNEPFCLMSDKVSPLKIVNQDITLGCHTTLITERHSFGLLHPLEDFPTRTDNAPE